MNPILSGESPWPIEPRKRLTEREKQVEVDIYQYLISIVAEYRDKLQALEAKAKERSSYLSKMWAKAGGRGMISLKCVVTGDGFVVRIINKNFHNCSRARLVH
jgi:hypothetical protein